MKKSEKNNRRLGALCGMNPYSNAFITKEAVASCTLDGETQCFPIEPHSQQETQAKGESPKSLVSELDNTEYAKKGLSKHNPADPFIPYAYGYPELNEQKTPDLKKEINYKICWLCGKDKDITKHHLYKFKKKLDIYGPDSASRGNLVIPICNECHKIIEKIKAKHNAYYRGKHHGFIDGRASAIADVLKIIEEKSAEDSCIKNGEYHHLISKEELKETLEKMK